MQLLDYAKHLRYFKKSHQIATESISNYGSSAKSKAYSLHLHI